ncbi:MAG: response regulator transcription factor [Bacteroidales bacterium]|nr:response regulator transcription factor [Bacteroidales bacterium]
MVKLFVVDRNILFRQCLKMALEKDNFAVSLIEVNELTDLIALVGKEIPDIVIFDLDSELFHLGVISEIVSKFPGIKFLALSFDLSRNKYFRLAQAGIKGCVLKNSDTSYLKQAILDVMVGKISFPEEILQQMIKNHNGNQKFSNDLTERESEVLHHLCNGLSNNEIAEKLHLSYDTVKWHRSNILIKSGCKNVLSLYKFAIQHHWVQLT